MSSKDKSVFRGRIKDPEILAMLDEPLGSPVNLTRERAIEVVQAGIGARPDLPPGEEYVRGIKHIWRDYSHLPEHTAD